MARTFPCPPVSSDRNGPLFVGLVPPKFFGAVSSCWLESNECGDLMMAVLFIIPGFIPTTNTLLREVTSVVIPGYPRVRPSFRFGSLCPDFKRMMETRDLPIQTNMICCVCILFNQRRGKKAMDGSIKVARDFSNRRFIIAHSYSSHSLFSIQVQIVLRTHQKQYAEARTCLFFQQSTSTTLRGSM